VLISFRTLEYGPWSWQSNQFHSINTLGFSPYHRFCDYVEGVYLDTNFTGYSQAELPDAKGVGVEKALEGYAQWVVDELLPGRKRPLSNIAMGGREY